MFTREIIGQFFFIAATAAGIIWLEVALALGEDREAASPPDISERTYVMVEAYLDSDKKTVKRAEIHDQWHLCRTVVLRENLPRRTRIAPRLTENGRFADLTRFFQFDDNTASLSRKPSAWASEVAKRLMAENK